jgi:BNR repeat protein
VKISRRAVLGATGACVVSLPFYNRVAVGECGVDAPSKLPIRVNQPRKIKAWELSAERVPVGVADDYKPTLTLLPDGRLAMTAVFEIDLPNKKYEFQTHLWESGDGGRTWSERRLCDGVQGHEPFITCSSKGTLFLTTTMMQNDPHNLLGADYMMVYRSVDMGHTWTGHEVVLRGAERVGVPEDQASMCSRKPIEMADGSLLLGVSINHSAVAYLWRSIDDGQHWEKTARVQIGKYHGYTYDNNYDSFFAEDFTFQNNSGKLVHFVRCGPPSPMYPMNDGRVTPARDDSGDRMLMCTSSDGGKTWSNLRDCGDYGVMYPRVIRLLDGRLMMTYTQRSLSYPIGLRAVFSEDDGETWNFDSDKLTIEGETPWGFAQGGGFGNTVQLSNGMLVSCSSYRGYDNMTHVKVVRWRLKA